MFFDGFYTCLYEVHRAAVDETYASEQYSEAVNDLFLFLDERRFQRFPCPFYDRTVRIFRHYLSEVLPKLGCSKEDCVEIYDQYAALISDLETSSLVSDRFEKACSRIFRAVGDGDFTHEHEIVEVFLNLAQSFYGIQNLSAETFSQTFRRKFPRFPGTNTWNQILEIFTQFITVLSDSLPDKGSECCRTGLANFREMFEFSLLCEFGAKAILIENTGDRGLVVPLWIAVETDRRCDDIEFIHHSVDLEMRRSAEMGRLLAWRYVKKEFGRELPEDSFVSCQFLHPVISCHDSSASLLIALVIVGKVLNLESRTDTAVTGALDSSGRITGVGWVLQKLTAAENAGDIRRVLVPEADMQTIVRYESTRPEDQQLHILPVRRFEDAVELYYGKEQLLAHQHHADWGESPDVPFFFGRTQELRILEQWVLHEPCRMVAIVGIKGTGKTRLSLNLRQGGIGKTDLSLTLARSIQGAFEFVIWRSLLNAPPLQDILSDLIEFLSNQQEIHLPETPREQLARLLHYLKTARCLIILDNAETILQSGVHTGEYRNGYADYGLFFKTVGEVSHQSCLLLTTREIPKDVAKLDGKECPVRSLHLGGLHDEDVKRLFSEIGTFEASHDLWNKLVQRYSGNPLALELAARRILSEFNGKIADFLRREKATFDNLNDLLHWHIKRLSEREKELAYWFAIDREPVSPADLQEDVVSPDSKAEVPLALESLKVRFPLEKSSTGFTLQPVLIEYFSKHFIEQICREILSGDLKLFNSHALFKASAKDYIGDIQRRLFLTPTISSWSPVNLEEELSHLLAILREESLEGSGNFIPDAIRDLLPSFQKKLTHISGSQKTLEAQLLHFLAILRKNSAGQTGYAAGNILNLLRELHPHLQKYDFSDLTVRQGDLRHVKVHDVNFTHASFRDTAFAEVFGRILSVAFSPDGTLFAAGMADGEIRIWRTRDRKQLATCRGHTDWVRSIAFSPDGNTLISACFDRTIRLWETKSGECLSLCKKHIGRVISVAVSPCGRWWASGGEDRTVCLWSMKDRRCVSVWRGHQHWVQSVTFFQDGEKLASADTRGNIRIWDMQTGGLLRQIEQPDPTFSLALSPDGILMAVGGGRDVYLWNRETGERISMLKGHHSDIRFLTFHPQGHIIASGSRDRTIRIWDTRTGQLLHLLQGHTSGIFSLAFSPDGSSLISGSDDQTLKFWDVGTGRQVYTLQGHSRRVRSLAVNSSGTLLASGGEDQVVHIWELPSGNYLNELAGHKGWINSLVFHPEINLLASGSSDYTIRIWNCETWQCLKLLRGHQHFITCLAFHPNGKWLASGSEDDTVRLWDIDTGKCLAIFDQFDSLVSSIVFIADGSFLAVNYEGASVCFVDIHSRQICRCLPEDSVQITLLACSPDGRVLASDGKDLTVQLWDTGNGRFVKGLEGHSQQIRAVGFHPNSRMIASAGVDRTVRVWDIESGACLFTLAGHSDIVCSVIFLPDRKTLVSSGSDETIKLWDITDGSCLNTLHIPGIYKGMNITGTSGLTNAQRDTLRLLGAIDDANDEKINPIK